MRSDATSAGAYLEAQEPERRTALARVREVILEHLPDGYVEAMQYGMIGYVIPLERYPGTYNGEPLAVAGLANQKKAMSLYLNCVYAEGGERFREEYRATGKRLDMGKSCVRFRSLDDLPLDLIGRTIAETSVDDFIRLYENSRRR